MLTLHWILKCTFESFLDTAPPRSVACQRISSNTIILLYAKARFLTVIFNKSVTL